MNSCSPGAVWGQKPHHQAAVSAVLGRVEGQDLIVHGQLVAVLIDQCTCIITLEGNRKDGQGPVTELHEENVSALA